MDTERTPIRAAKLAMWFSAAFAVFFSALALLSFGGLVGNQRDALNAAFMAGGGALVFAANWAAVRLFA